MGEDDRRSFQRKKKQNVLSFHIIEDDVKILYEGIVVDGSPGGVRFRSKSSIAKNTRLYIKLDSEEWGEELTYLCSGDRKDLVEVIGSVMWCLENQNTPGEYEVGTRFVGLVEQ